MQFRIIISLAFLSIVYLAAMTGSTGCANIIPPSGGPRDSLPPILEKVTPGDSSKNFSANRIVFSFNEFIELQNVQQNLVISPLPINFPTVDYRLNTVTIRLKDSLEANTTYSLQFGESIKDFTEGNVLKNFTYTFSTGPYIDSLELRGKVILAETGKIDSTLIVLLHTSPDDSAVAKERPRYITKLDSRGNFIFKNLPPRTFYLFALKDDGGTRRYYDEKQLFAFADKPVSITDSTKEITLYAYSVKPPASSMISGFSLGGRNKTTGGADRRLKYQTNLASGQQDLLKDFIITFDDPLKVFDSLKLSLYTDSAYNPVSSCRFQQDSLAKTVTISHTWKENTDYHLVMDKDFAEDSSGKKLLKTDTLSFRTKKLTDYGSLKLKFKNIDLALNPVLFIMAGETIVQSVPLPGSEINLPLFTPGEYDLRILYDQNKNGKWDPGEYFGKRIQPELVKPVERRISVKPAFQNEFDITL